jgi:demethoxyubiquinone hydroxylase (CLK1/Coq7/Cat5 family)/predicted DCC family thiol-disulfide oxidoreductase YuxK
VTVYFDGACPVCAREIAVYRRQRGAEACAWVDVTRCSDVDLGPGLTREAALARLHVRDGNGRLASGARGFAVLWRALPGTGWLGRLAAFGPMPWLLEAGYRGFLVLRRAWRPPAAVAPWPTPVLTDLRSDHAGEAGAVRIYDGILAVTRDPALRDFATRHRATEQARLALIETHLPRRWRSRALPLWRIAGWLAGALPALVGPRAVYATVEAVETVVNVHYLEQVQRLDRSPAGPASRRLRDDLERCRLDERAHRDEAGAAAAWTGRAAAARHRHGPLLRGWTALVGGGSAAAVSLARRF